MFQKLIVKFNARFTPVIFPNLLPLVHGYQKIFNLRKAKPEVRKQETNGDPHERERIIMDALSPYSKDRKQSNLTQVTFDRTTEITKNTSIVFVILPQWAYNFPPYNVARLAAVTKNAGYATHAFDLNANNGVMLNDNRCANRHHIFVHANYVRPPKYLF